jgi:hypothetical protein
VRDRHLVLGYRRGHFVRETVISSTVQVAEMDSKGAFFRFTLQPKSEWNVKLQVTSDWEGPAQAQVLNRRGNRHEAQFERLDHRHGDRHLPPEGVRFYMRSLVDIAALRFRPDTMPDRSLPAAGLPWFMAPCSDVTV